MGRGHVQREAGGQEDSHRGAETPPLHPVATATARMLQHKAAPPRPAFSASALGFPAPPAALHTASGACCPLVSVAPFAGRGRPVANSYHSFLKSLVTLK